MSFFKDEPNRFIVDLPPKWEPDEGIRTLVNACVAAGATLRNADSKRPLVDAGKPDERVIQFTAAYVRGGAP